MPADSPCIPHGRLSRASQTNLISSVQMRLFLSFFHAFTWFVTKQPASISSEKAVGGPRDLGTTAPQVQLPRALGSRPPVSSMADGQVSSPCTTNHTARMPRLWEAVDCPRYIHVIYPFRAIHRLLIKRSGGAKLGQFKPRECSLFLEGAGVTATRLPGPTKA